MSNKKDPLVVGFVDLGNKTGGIFDEEDKRCIRDLRAAASGVSTMNISCSGGPPGDSNYIPKPVEKVGKA